MRISFDIDDTLVCGPQTPAEQCVPWWGRWWFPERLRHGTRALMRDLHRRGHRLWIYTTSYRSSRYLRAWFWSIGVPLEDAVNQDRHDDVVGKMSFPGYPPSKYPRAFGIDLHVDDSGGVAIEDGQFGFGWLLWGPTTRTGPRVCLRRSKDRTRQFRPSDRSNEMRSFVCLLTLLVPAMARAGEGGFVPLFNGKDLDGWEVRESRAGDKEKWSAKDAVLTALPGSGWIGTTKMYGDFVLRLEWRVPVNGNSGVFLRVPDVKSKASPSQLGMEIQVLDDTGPAYKGKLKDWQYSGSLYGFVPPSRSVYKSGEWNRFEITCKGDLVTVVFNGEKVVEADMSKFPELDKRPRRGFIGLQNHSTGIEYRNIQIKVLDGK